MACQFQSRGLSPHRLIIGDTYCKRGPHYSPLSWKASAFLFPFVVHPKRIGSLIKNRYKTKKNALRATQKVNEQHAKLVDAHHNALAHYIPGHYDGDITVVRGTELNRKTLRLDAYFPKRDFGWSKLTAGVVTVETLVGGHHELFYNANAKNFAQILERSVATARTIWNQRASYGHIKDDL